MELFAVGAIITGIIGVGIHVFQSISNIGDIDLDFSGLSSGSFPVPQDLPVYDQPTENPELQQQMVKAQQTRISLVRDRMLQAQPFLEMMESATPFCFSISAETLTQLQQLFKDPRAMEEAVRVSMDLFHKKAHMSQGDLPGGDIAMLQGSDDFGILQVLILGLAGKMIDMPQAQAKGSLKSLQGSEGGGMPPDAFLALTTIDGQHIQQLIQVLFRIDVFNIAKDKDHQGQYLFFVNPAAFPQFLRQNFDTMERSQWGLGTARIIELLDLPVIQRLDWRPNLQKQVLQAERLEMSQFNDMMHQGKPLLDIMKSGTPITISVDTKMLKQFLHLFINTPALEECVRLGMNLYNQNISMRREGGQPTGENFGVPQRTFRLRSPSKPREGIETGLGRQNFNEPQGLFPPFAQDGIQIRRFLQFLFHIKVLSIYKDPIHLGQHLIFVDFRRLQSFIEPHIRKTGPTVTINEIFTDDESSSEKDKATSSEEDDEEVVIELPEDLVFEVPVLGAAPLCAAEVRSSATSAVMSTAGLCATVLLSLLLM